MKPEALLSVSGAVAGDGEELCRFWSRHCAVLSPHLLMPDSLRGWSQCLEDGTMRWFVSRLGADVVAVGVLARITGIPWRSGEVGVGVDPSVRGRGIGRTTLRAIFAMGFGDGLMRIEALVDPRNRPSMRMVEGAGMLNEGISRAVLEFEGTRVDAARWAILAADVSPEHPER